VPADGGSGSRVAARIITAAGSCPRCSLARRLLRRRTRRPVVLVAVLVAVTAISLAPVLWRPRAV